ncbi:TetR/AcrR family transcriptional regulator [Sphingomonas sp. F9_3S_D5_B_2]
MSVSAGGKSVTLDEIAGTAQVSRATAYRYFPNVEDLLAEASLHVAFPDPECLSTASDDPVERLLLIDDAVERMVTANETALRMMIASASKLPLQSGDVPARQNRRLPLIEAALAPARSHFAPEAYKRVTEALCLVIGTEAMLVFKDVLGLTPKQAREARRWTIKSLIEAALRNE